MNLRPSGYEPDELPTAPPREKNGGWNRIRTYVGVSRQIYSLLPLTTREPIRLRQKELYKITAKLSTTFLKNILQKPNLSFTHAKIRL